MTKQRLLTLIHTHLKPCQRSRRPVTARRCSFQFLSAEGAQIRGRRKPLTSCFLVPAGLAVMTPAPPAGLLSSRSGLFILISLRVGFHQFHFTLINWNKTLVRHAGLRANGCWSTASDSSRTRRPAASATLQLRTPQCSEQHNNSRGKKNENETFFDSSLRHKKKQELREVSATGT